MKALYISSQPGRADGKTLLAAYQPMVFSVVADTTASANQPMYADVIFYDTYYKTIVGYSTVADVGGSSIYAFDIQDAAQEYLDTMAPPVPCGSAVASFDGYNKQIARCYVLFRGSSYDSNGLLVPEATVPVQATATTASSFDIDSGIPSLNFYVVNGSLLPGVLNPININPLEDALDALRLTDAPIPFSYSGCAIYPLTNLPKNPCLAPDLSLCPDVYVDDYGCLPIFVSSFPSGATSESCNIMMIYFKDGATTYSGYFEILPYVPALSFGTWYLPVGLGDLLSYASDAQKAFITNPANNVYFRMAIHNLGSAAGDSGWCFYSPLYRVRGYAQERVRLYFQNMYGHYEQVTFTRNSEDFITTSGEQFQSYVTYPNAPIAGRQRFNVRGHDELSLMGTFSEGLMPWLKELLLSRSCYQQYTDANGNVALRGVEVLDGTFKTRKTMMDGRFSYVVKVKIRPSIEYITLR